MGEVTAPTPPPLSLWHQTSPPIPTDTGIPNRTNVLVVGAGLTGLAVAAMLVGQGQRPLVIDAHRVGALTTGGTTGKLSLLQGSTLSQVRSHAGDDAVRAYVSANSAGIAWLVNALADHPDAIAPRTAVTYATTAEGLQSLDSEAEACSVAGLALAAEGTGFRTDLPFPVRGALGLGGQWQLHPMRMLAVLTALVRSGGGAVVEGCRLVRADAAADGVRVETTAGEILAERVILATGTPVLDRGLYFATLEPTREFVAAYVTEEPAPADMYLSVDPVSRSLRTAHDASGADVLLVGGDSFTPGRDRDTPARLAKLDRWTRDRFEVSTRVTWWGAQDYRPVTRIPVAVPIPGGHDRVFAASGYNKWGMSNAVAAAMAVVGQLSGEVPEWAHELSGSAPSLRDVGSAASANLSVGGWYLKGWAGALTRGRTLPDEATVHRAGGRPVAESTADGVTCRVSGVCTHLGGILEWNGAERSWDCPLHGSRFNPDGTVIEGPATRPLQPLGSEGSGEDVGGDQSASDSPS